MIEYRGTKMKLPIKTPIEKSGLNDKITGNERKSAEHVSAIEPLMTLGKILRYCRKCG
jgi:hypothetical protein